MDKYTGKRLDGRYEIQELIGVGGMAMVYRAHDIIDDKTVAIKILKDEFIGNEEFIRRFKNETKAIAVLSHKNIVKVFDVSFGDRIQYIVMEYIDGITLKEYINHQHEIPWKEAVHFTVQILQALQHAHSKGIVHRDVKPQNIMLLQDGSIKVTDFGIARFSNTEPRTMTGKAIGSVHYIAPEQARGDVTDGKADIYSVGVMLYEMLTGTLPFEAESAVSVAIMQLQNDPKPLREINDKIPEGLEEITLKAMRKDPKQRYASADEMLDAIEIFRHNPAVKFKYSYFVDETPTKFVSSLNSVSSALPESENDMDEDMIEDEVLTSNRSKSIVKWVTIAVSVLVIASLILLVTLVIQNVVSTSEVPSVDVPNFVNQSYEQIKRNKDYKFNFEITAKYDSTQPVNIVLAQDPEAGSKQIKENATIKLTINSTETTTEVPKLKNYTEQEAIEKLSAKYFNYDVQRVTSANVAKGTVIECSPQEGTNQEVGTIITLIVSDGPQPEQVAVPDVVGSSYEQAKAELEAQGFTTQKATVASNKEAGLVVGTDPLAGNLLTKGTQVTIRVSDGSKILRPLKQRIDLPEDEHGQITVTIYVDGQKVDESSGVPYNGFSKTVELDPKGAVNNQKVVTVMIDGIKYETFVYDFKNQTVSRTYINTDYKLKEAGEEESSEEESEEESSENSEEDSNGESSDTESSTEESSEDEEFDEE